jgi:hypothetical protein
MNWEDEREVFSTGKKLLFGSDTGLTLFLGSILFFSLLWRTDVFLSDSFAVANALIAASRGDVVISTFVYGPESGVMPGMLVGNGKLVARNYGQVAAALPVFLALTGLTVVAKLHSVLLAVWSLVLYAFLSKLAAQTQIVTRWRVAGTVVVLASINAVVLDPIPSRMTAYVSLQMTTMIAAALSVVFFYRLTRTIADSRTALLSSVALAVASPVGFFATVPKRHSFSVLFLLAGMFLLYRARIADDIRYSNWYRAGAYSTTGLLTWIHAPEGATLLFAIVGTDVVSSRRNNLLGLAYGLSGLLISLVPFFITNVFVSGNPFLPPRLLPEYEGDPGLISDSPSGDTGTGGGDTGGGGGDTGGGGGDTGAGGGDTGAGGGDTGTGGGGSVGGGNQPGVIESVVGLFDKLVAVVYILLTSAGGAIRNLLSVVANVTSMVATEVETSTGILLNRTRSSQIFLRRGYYPGVSKFDPEASNLSMLESMPILGVLSAGVAGIPDLSVARVRRWYHSPAFTPDAVGLIYSVGLLLLAGARLPIEESFTVRYLHPLYAFGLYLLCRSRFVRTILREQESTIKRAFVATVVIGIPSYTFGILTSAAVLSEAVQLYATTAFIIGVTVSLTTVLSVLSDVGGQRKTAIVFGAAAGIVTVYLVVFSTVVVGTEHNFLPVLEAISKHLEYTHVFK